MIELGCGPFTNLRYIVQECKVGKVSLLDPLINEYLNHPYCFYNGEYLYCDLNKDNSKKVEIDNLFNIPIENLETTNKFDLVVIVNVIEHCFNIPKILGIIDNLLANDGIIIFHDRYYTASKLTKELDYTFDAGHPIKTDRYVIDEFLKNYNQIYKYVDNREFVFLGKNHKYDAIYFIGSKKNNKKTFH